ncbi:hypothetical protein MFLAVUS_001469 [Mucor flavus]|uniref:Uncharacterized protein n=1 Tax=Mucor flavus TaxID=439312 RepID=A0ABP9YMJ9_9FUNG
MTCASRSNYKELSLDLFATRFGYQDKNEADNRYSDIINSNSFKTCELCVTNLRIEKLIWIS